MATAMSDTGSHLTTHHWEMNSVAVYALGVAVALFAFFHFVVEPMKGQVPATTLTYKVQPQIQDVDIRRVPVTHDSQKASSARPVPR